MLKAAYKLSVAGWSVDSAADPRTELVELDVFRAQNAPSDYCRITAYTPAGGSEGALEEIGGAAAAAIGIAGDVSGTGFSVDLRGQAVAPADRVTIELTSGEVTDTVMTADVQSVQSSLGLLTVHGRTALERLAATRINRVYESQSLDQIVRDLASQAGVQVGDIDSGSTYPYVVVHESGNVFRAVRRLAAREGMDVAVDTSNRLTVKAFSRSAADHVFRYAAELLDVWHDARDPTADHVLVHGESPSSTTGSDTWHWLAHDLSPFRGESGSGVRSRALQDGALRTKDAAGKAADARLATIQDGSTAGWAKVLGQPSVDLGQAIEIRDAPKPHLNGLFKVTSVRHVFSKSDGFVTVVGFSGQGAGSAGAGSLSAVAGALG